MGHRLARLFAYDHLPEHLREISAPFSHLADKLMLGPNAGDPLVDDALMKLWEAKNLAVCAAARP